MAIIRSAGASFQMRHWRPVLVLHIGPDGHPRARELASLLKDSGIELRTSTAAGTAPQNAETR